MVDSSAAGVSASATAGAASCSVATGASAVTSSAGGNSVASTTTVDSVSASTSFERWKINLNEELGETCVKINEYYMQNRTHMLSFTVLLSF